MTYPQSFKYFLFYLIVFLGFNISAFGASGYVEWTSYWAKGQNQQEGAPKTFIDIVEGGVGDLVKIEWSSQGFQYRWDREDFYFIQLYNQYRDKLPKSRDPGTPELPFYSTLINAHPSEIDLSVVSDPSSLVAFSKKDFRPSPSRLFPCRCKGGDIEFVINQKIYQELGDVLDYQVLTPAVSIEYLGRINGENLSRIIVRPFKWTGEELYFFSDFDIKINWSEQFRETSFDRYLSVGYQEILENIYALRENSSKMLLILDSKYHEQLTPYLQRRQEQGFEIKVLSPNQLLGEKEKNFVNFRKGLRDLYENWECQYVILFGDEEDIPTDYVVTTFNRQTPSDLEYFNYRSDLDDFLPDVFYARYPIYSTADLSGFMEKVEDFERRDGQGGFLGIASNEGFAPTDKEYIEQMAEPFIDGLERQASFFHQNNSKLSQVPLINEAIASGPFWVNYIGHGLGEMWTSLFQEDYHNDDVLGLDFTQDRPIIVDIACQNGRFSKERKLGTQFMLARDYQQAPLGASAFYGGSVDITWHPPAIMAVGMNDYLVNQMQDKNREKPLRLGEVLLAGQLYLLENHINYFEVRENFYWYHLIGDPSMIIRF